MFCSVVNQPLSHGILQCSVDYSGIPGTHLTCKNFYPRCWAIVINILGGYLETPFSSDISLLRLTPNVTALIFTSVNNTIKSVAGDGNVSYPSDHSVYPKICHLDKNHLDRMRQFLLVSLMSLISLMSQVSPMILEAISHRYHQNQLLRFHRGVFPPRHTELTPAILWCASSIRSMIHLSLFRYMISSTIKSSRDHIFSVPYTVP